MKIIEEVKTIRDIPVMTCRRDDNLKKPLVIISHGFTGSKADFKKNGCLIELAESGYYAAAVDNRLHGDRPGPNFRETVLRSSDKIDLITLRKAMKETADDVRLLIDELSVLDEIEENRIAMIGISMGGFITYRSIVVDDRIKVGIPIISSPFWDDIPGDIPVLKDDKMINRLALLSKQYQPSEYSDRFYPTALLMQAGDKDKHYDIKKVLRFYNGLNKYYHDFPERLKLIIYPDTKHEFKHEMWEQSLQWLKDHL